MKEEHHIYLKGKVQGVFLRSSAKRIAKHLNLYGWIQNLDNGDVEICVQGSLEEAQAFIRELQKEPKPKIFIIEISSRPLETTYTSFAIVEK